MLLGADGRGCLAKQYSGHNQCNQRCAGTGTVRRFVFASTNHVMHGLTMGAEGTGSMSLDRLSSVGVGAIRADHPFAPDSAYAVSKIFGEVLGKYHSKVLEEFEFVALRIGWCAYDEPSALDGTVHEEYLRAMWLSKRDAVGFINSAMEVDLHGEQFRAAYAVSNNATCPFDLEGVPCCWGTHPLTAVHDRSRCPFYFGTISVLVQRSGSAYPSTTLL